MTPTPSRGSINQKNFTVDVSALRPMKREREREDDIISSPCSEGFQKGKQEDYWDRRSRLFSPNGGEKFVLLLSAHIREWETR